MPFGIIIWRKKNDGGGAWGTEQEIELEKWLLQIKSFLKYINSDKYKNQKTNESSWWPDPGVRLRDQITRKHTLEFTRCASPALVIADSNYWDDFIDIIASRCAWASPWIVPLMFSIASSLVCSFPLLTVCLHLEWSNQARTCSFSISWLHTEQEWRNVTSRQGRLETVRANVKSPSLKGNEKLTKLYRCLLSFARKF